MSGFSAFDITRLADMLKSVDLDRKSDDDSDNENSSPSSAAAAIGPAQIAPSTSKYTENLNKSKDTTKKSFDKGNDDWKFNQIHSIWSENEVKEKETLCNNAGPLGDDPRKVPTYNLHFRQSVTTEDMFLQMGNKTPATASCEALIVEILLPGENHHDVQLDLKSDSVALRSPKYILFLPLPQPVDPRAGNAKWFTGEDKLVLTLVLARELDILNF